MTGFARALLAWAEDHGRRDLPWQPQPGMPADPYKVWVSEIMLQQTQVQSVRAYFIRFVERFPTVDSLAQASLDEVLALWSGLGYYARARNLHRAAQQISAWGRGGLPEKPEDWACLPGVGRSTAAAIVSICFGHRSAILDANVRRVLARQLAASEPWGSSALDQRLWKEAEARLPARGEEMPRYTQALMDLGATVCLARRPQCSRCPVRDSCQAFADARVADFPVPRKRLVKPLRTEQWLLVVDRGTVGLWQRPAEGLWGGLWSPWVVSTTPVGDSGGGQQPPWPDGATPLTLLTHSFTHFTLKAEVCIARPSSRRALAYLSGIAKARGQPLVFKPREEFLCLGLPAPVRRLLVQAPLGE
jgi:A/G-specific adenine glycosylase